jgi:outer membrane protein OmpA-like peptidoglycan-associated protein
MYGPMVNAIYDLTGLLPFPYVAPYAGAGVGYQWINEQHVNAFGSLPDGTPASVSLNGTKGSFAYQAIVGAAMPIPVLPGLALTAEYRFLGTTGNRTYSATAVVDDVAFPGSVKLGHDFNNSVLIGLRYNFGVAPPPPAPAPVAAPAPAPARSYLVFFDWDKATLTDRARQIIREAAENSTHVSYTAIEVNGYTDTSGTPQYNMGLSIRRANAVAAELVRDGVPRNVISIHGFGETHLLVPTGPGVREPQNRRVEIIIR